VPTAVERLAGEVTNELPRVSPRYVTGIIGDKPSQYAKTPHLWNAVFHALGLDAISLPWDLPDNRLGSFLAAVRDAPDVAGFSVTQPFKIAVTSLLDELDPLAARIGAVNTVVRRADGRLIGFNTDGQGAIDALMGTMPGNAAPLLQTLRGRNVLIVGAGGAARAVAFFIASEMGATGRLRIVNRDAARARRLADAVSDGPFRVEAGGEDRLAKWIGEADLVVNASVKGQSGWRRDEAGNAFMLEPYSSLAPAAPSVLAGDRPLNAGASAEWFAESRPDIDRNNTAGRQMASRMRPNAVCFDLIYSPLETRFLADARFAGHQTLNGKWMNVAQAADAFARKVCPDVLASAGMSEEARYSRVFDVMASAW
jgi:shikimate 5-dehydrogenase